MAQKEQAQSSLRRIGGVFDPRGAVGLIVDTVLAGLILRMLAGEVPLLAWLSNSSGIPWWLIITLAAAFLWLGARQVIQMRRPRFVDGAYYATDDPGHTHPFCMYCLEHAGMLVTVREHPPQKAGSHAYECVTHQHYEWP